MPSSPGIPAGPVPIAVAVSTEKRGEDDGAVRDYVVLQVQTPAGTAIYYFRRNGALTVASTLREAAKSIPQADDPTDRPAIATPAKRLLVPGR